MRFFLFILLIASVSAHAGPSALVDRIDRDPPAKLAKAGARRPVWDHGTTGAWQELPEGTGVGPGDSVQSGDAVAIRLALLPERSTITLAEGGSTLRLEGLTRFQLVTGAAFANLFQPRLKPHVVRKLPLPLEIFAVLKTEGIFIGMRKSARLLLLAPGAHGPGEPAAVYAMTGELEVATQLELLLKGQGLRVPPGHGILVTGPNGVESPRPFSSEHDLLLRYPSLRRVRELGIQTHGT